MSSTLEFHVQKILREIDCGKTEKADIKEELLCHLYMSKEQFIENGHEDKEAEQLAIKEFGTPDLIGGAMQEAMFPHRRLFFLILAIVSLIATFTTYLTVLMTEGDALFGWLIFAVITSTLLLLFTGQQLVKLERKSWMIATLLVHILIFIYGYLIANMLNHWLRLPLTFLIAGIIIFSIFLIYRVTLYDYSKGEIKVLHAINITLGIPYIGATLFFSWAALAFMEGFQPFVLIGLVPLLIWLVSYILQAQLMKRRKIKAAYTVLVVAIFLGIFMVWSVYN